MIEMSGHLGDATFSDCMTYRYRLTRSVPGPLRWVRVMTWLMLNPSTATEDINDPTVAKCIKFAELQNYSHVNVVNIFALRSTDPKALKVVADPVGPDNDRYIVDICRTSDSIVCGWGNHGKFLNRGRQVAQLLLDNNIENLNCLSNNQDGSPVHPLYQTFAVLPALWSNISEYATNVKVSTAPDCRHAGTPSGVTG